MNLLDRYQESLRKRTTPGEGCHGWLLATANYGTIAGLTGDQLFTDLRRAIPPGKRRIPDKEITDAINKARSDHSGGTFTPKACPAPVVNDGKAALQKIIDQGKISDEADLWEASPIRLREAP